MTWTAFVSYFSPCDEFNFFGLCAEIGFTKALYWNAKYFSLVQPFLEFIRTPFNFIPACRLEFRKSANMSIIWVCLMSVNRFMYRLFYGCNIALKYIILSCLYRQFCNHCFTKYNCLTGKYLRKDWKNLFSACLIL